MGNTGSTYSGTRKVNSHRHSSRSGGNTRHRANANNVDNSEAASTTSFSKNELGKSQSTRISSSQPRNKTKRNRKSRKEQKQEEEDREEIDDSI